MSKHEVARKILNQFRNAHYNDIGCDENKVVAQALNEILPYLVATEKAYEQLQRDVNRYFEIRLIVDKTTEEWQELDYLYEKLSKGGVE